MIRLYFIVEGQTEEAFVKEIIAPYLGQEKYFTIPVIVPTRNNRKENRIYKGGYISYARLKKYILSLMRKDTSAYFTTMIDLYKLQEDFPQYKDYKDIQDPFEKVKCFEEAFKSDICNEVGGDRFTPYIQLHEFEALLLSDPIKFSEYYIEDYEQKAVEELAEEIFTYESPEHVNHGNPPSKRIIKKIKKYDKPASGTIIASEIGIEQIIKKCKHFSEWICRLEELTQFKKERI